MKSDPAPHLPLPLALLRLRRPARAGRPRAASRVFRALVVAALAAAALTWQMTVAAQPAPPCGLDLRVLVVSADGGEVDLPAIQQGLDYIGIPFTTYIASQHPAGLSADLLANGCRGLYQGVILTTNVALAAGDAQTLSEYETAYGVRQVTWYTWPTPEVGFNWATEASGVDVDIRPTSAGAEVFAYLNTSATAAPITIQHSWAYHATALDASTTPLLTDPEGHALVAVHRYPDGRENLAMTFDSNQYLRHSTVLSYGVINWVTRGLFVGDRHVYMSPQVDDIFLPNVVWNPSVPCLTDPDLTGFETRMTGTDLEAVYNWQTAHRQQPMTADLRLTMAFNGEGTTGSYGPDTLTPVARQRQDAFLWVSHTWDHENLDAISYTAATGEITQNHAAALDLGLNRYSLLSIVQPDVSGLNNANFLRAARDAGLRYLLSDTSKPNGDNPTPNTGRWSALRPELFVIPRRANNLFFNVAAPADWVAEYNCLYQSFWGRSLTFDEILDVESDALLGYLLRGELDMWMFHQANLVAYDGVHTLLGDLLDRTIEKYRGYYTLPILSPSMDVIGDRMIHRTAWRAAGISATSLPNGSLTLVSPVDVTVPITGLHLPNAEFYGGQWISWVTLTASTPLTIPPPGPVAAPVATAAAVAPVQSGALVTLSGTASDPNVPPLPLTYQWTQTAGLDTPVTLANATTLAPTFTAPALPPGVPSTFVGFTLTVSNGSAATTATTTALVRTGPLVVGTTPSNGAEAIAPGAPVVITFNEDLDPATVNATSLTLRGAGGVLLPASIGYSGVTATLTPSSPLALGTVHTVTLKGGAAGIGDSYGHTLAADYSWSFTTVTDTTPPQVVNSAPASGAAGVALTATATVTFDEPMSAATISGTTLTLTAPGGPAVPAAVAYASATRTATITPLAPLAYLTTYTVVVKGGAGGAADVAGNPLAGDYTSTFTTMADLVPPVVSALKVVPTGTTALITWTTNEASTSRVDYGTSADALGASATIDPITTAHSVLLSGLAINTTYYFRVTSFDAAANGVVSPLPPAAPVGFFIANPSGLVAAFSMDEATGTTITDSSGAGNHGTISGATWTAGRYGSGLSFNGLSNWVTIEHVPSLDLTSAVTLEAWTKPVTSTGRQPLLYKERPGTDAGPSWALYSSDDNGPPAIYGAVPGNIWAHATGTALAPLNGWTHVVGTYNGTSLRLYVNGTLVRTVASTGGLLPAGGPLRIGGNSISIPYGGQWFNGVIDEIRVYNRALTQAEIQADMATPLTPSVTAMTPAADSINVALATPVTATFSQAMAPETISGATMLLQADATLEPVPAVVTYAAATRKATLTPVAPLAMSTAYRVTVKGGQAGVKDAVGNGMTADRSWLFTTVVPDTQPPAMTALKAVPATATAVITWTTNEPSTTRVDYGTSAQALTSSAGNNTLVTAHSVTLSGLAPNTTYFFRAGSIDAVANEAVLPALADAPATFYVANATGLVAAFSLDEATGTTIVDSSGAGNHGTISGAAWTSAGRYGSALAFDGAGSQVTIAHAPSLALSGAMTLEAWVKPTTTTGRQAVLYKERGAADPSADWALYASDDSAPPAVYAAVPSNASARAAGTALASTSAWTHVVGTYNGSALRLYVNGALVRTVTLSGGLLPADGPLQIGGNAISVGGQWFNGAIDEIRIYNRALTQAEIQTDMATPLTPTVSSVTPAPASSGVALSPSITAIFAQAMTAETISAATVLLQTDQTLEGVAATVSYAAATRKVTIAPALPLAPQTTYRVTVKGGDAGVKDAAGASMVSDYVWTFTTVVPDTVPPVITVLKSTPGSASAVIAWTTNEPSTTKVTYGSSPQALTQTANNAAMVSAHSLTLSGLTAGATYYYRAASTDAAANEAVSPAIDVAPASFVVPAVPGLVAAFNFNEGSGTVATDLSGNGNTGTISGATWTASGRTGGALSFDGAGDWVTINDAPSLGLTNAMTLEAWIRPAASSGWRTIIYKERPEQAGLSYALYSSDDNAPPAVYAAMPTNAWAHATGSAMAALNTWTHVVGTFNGTSLRLYVNGTLVRTTTLSANLSPSSGALRIGGNAISPNGQWFSGIIDEVRIYNRVLTQAEITTNMTTPVR